MTKKFHLAPYTMLPVTHHNMVTWRLYRVIVTVRPQWADTHSSHVPTGREKPRSTVRDLLSRPDYDPIQTALSP